MLLLRDLRPACTDKCHLDGILCEEVVEMPSWQLPAIEVCTVAVLLGLRVQGGLNLAALYQFLQFLRMSRSRFLVIDLNGTLAARLEGRHLSQLFH